MYDDKNTAVKIISFQADAQSICASAARISTTEGDALHIYGHSRECGGEKNAKLIRRVLDSGHKSFIEHAVMTIAFRNVSVFVEQFMIEFRLASFTVKSRRYVNFEKMGYYVPDGLSMDAKNRYKRHMDGLFSEYRFFLEQGIPREDARFVLPYCFYSNFYCTVNARELITILQEMLYGRGSRSKEIVKIAKQLREQLEDLFPELAEEIGKEMGNEPCFYDKAEFSAGKNETLEEVGADVELLQYPREPEEILFRAGRVSKGLSYAPPSEEEFKKEIGELLGDRRPRALEQLSYTYLIKNVSLAGLTHIVRHRMQSICIPPLSCAQRTRYIIPDSICKDGALLERYEKIYADNARAADEIMETGFAAEDLAYFNLSGNTVDILTTMNAREMMLFFKLRCCKRAQWEVRNIAKQMLEKAKINFPALFEAMGPSCKLERRCPEGRLSCGYIDKVKTSEIFLP